MSGMGPTDAKNANAPQPVVVTSQEDDETPVVETEEEETTVEDPFARMEAERAKNLDATITAGIANGKMATDAAIASSAMLAHANVDKSNMNTASAIGGDLLGQANTMVQAYSQNL